MICHCFNCDADWSDLSSFDPTELSQIVGAVNSGYCYACTAPLIGACMIGVQPNYGALTRSCHSFDLPRMCPVSGNPQPGSVLEVHYTAREWFLEIETLGEYIASYIGGKQLGRAFVRDMEQTIQAITAECAASVGVRVVCIARLKIADDPAERTRIRDYRVIVRSD